MGHEIIRCSCNNDIMEGDTNTWLCEKCGRLWEITRGGRMKFTETDYREKNRFNSKKGKRLQ